MRVMIAGAGIAGLATALALREIGLKPVLIERAAELTEVGAAVTLGAHAMRVLEHLGAADHLRELHIPPENMEFHDVLSGELRASVPFGETGKRMYGEKFYTCHRRDLIDALAGRLGDTEVRLDAQVTRIEEKGDQIAVHLADGDTIHADLLVGADGLRSAVRTSLFGEGESVFTHSLAWRTIIPAKNFKRALPDNVRLWLGSGRHVVSYPLRRGKIVYAGFYVPDEEIHREDWSNSGDVSELRASFADACPDVRELVDAVEDAFITGIFYRPPLDQWHKGRVVLVGDAAHSVLPTSGTGAGMALEDGVTLAACLQRHGDDFAAAFSEYQARRKPRTSRILMSSRADLDAFHEQDPARARWRGGMTRGIAALDPTGNMRLKSLYGHDAIAEAALPFETVQAKVANPLKRPEARRAFDLWRGALRLEDHAGGWLGERAGYARFERELAQYPSDVRIEEIDCDGVAALKVIAPGGENGPAALHLHGGGFMFGSASGAVPLAAGIARAIQGWVVVPDYRLAPENPAPAALDDALCAYRWMAQRARRALLTGEDAGGGLALGVAARLAETGDAPPGALFLASPFVDLTLGAASIDANAEREPWLQRARLLMFAGAYAQGQDVTLPALSPIRARPDALPPLRVFAAADEALADDARALVDAAKAACADAALTLVEDSVHSYVLFDFLPETAEFLNAIGRHAKITLNSPDTVAI